ncbi:MAG: Holliday junction resolvase RuvX [Endomicrobium sp.]|jgi:putative Holliday junction resolvase|nr:Holliday junction resolvase RuvX [Endomicrobium sp.]
MDRIMGIDYGLKRIGIAMTDMLQITACPFDTIKSMSFKKDAVRLLEIAQKNDSSVMVFGLPINMNGTEGKMTNIVHKVIKEIRTISDIEVATVDERLTTVQAERMLIEEYNISRDKRKNLKDQITAALILQIYCYTLIK